MLTRTLGGSYNHAFVTHVCARLLKFGGGGEGGLWF